jgi:thiamine monophosphate synthase
VAEGADFVFVGALFRTPSHPDTEAVGVELVSRSAGEANGQPVIGIGGVGPEQVEEIIDAGGHGVAVVRSVWANEDPAGAVGRLLDALRFAPTGGVLL